MDQPTLDDIPLINIIVPRLHGMQRFAGGVLQTHNQQQSMMSLGGLFYFMSIYVDVPVKIGVVSFSIQQ